PGASIRLQVEVGTDHEERELPDARAIHLGAVVWQSRFLISRRKQKKTWAGADSERPTPTPPREKTTRVLGTPRSCASRPAEAGLLRNFTPTRHYRAGLFSSALSGWGFLMLPQSPTSFPLPLPAVRSQGARLETRPEARLCAAP